MGASKLGKAYRFKENDSRSICCKVFESMTTLGCDLLNFQTIDIPEGVTSIDFYKCVNLVNVTVPSTVTELRPACFTGCTSLTYVRMLPTTPPTLVKMIQSDPYNHFNDSNNCPIYVPAASLTAYQTAPGWSNYASRIQVES